ncbi:hypothetical protein [Aliiglaciecola litoralis]
MKFSPQKEQNPPKQVLIANITMGVLVILLFLRVIDFVPKEAKPSGN